MQTSNLFAAFTLKTERKRIYHYHLSCILTSDVSDDVAPLRFTIGRSGSIPAGIRGSLSPPYYVCESAVRCQYLSYETKDGPFPQCPQIFQWLARGAGKLYCSQPMWVPLSRSSSKRSGQFMPHSLHVWVHLILSIIKV